MCSTSKTLETKSGALPQVLVIPGEPVFSIKRNTDSLNVGEIYSSSR